MEGKWLFVFLSLAFMSTCWAFDSCTVMTWPGAQRNLTTRNANSSCTEGSVWWNYPEGILQVNFTSTTYQEFTLCLNWKMGMECSNIYNVIPAGLVNITASNQQTDAMCAASNGGHVIIQFDAPEDLTYMNLYSYMYTYVPMVV